MSVTSMTPRPTYSRAAPGVGELAWSALTNAGVVRQRNEDCFALDARHGLFVVCDGMGGHPHGDVASSTACAAIHGWVTGRPPSSNPHAARDLLVEAIHVANRRVFQLAKDEPRPGTTVAAILWAHGGFIVAHVGDSKVYRLRRGALVQLTRDHSLANHLIDLRVLRAEDAADFPQRHVLNRALGLHQEVDVDVQACAVKPGDGFLLASDGLDVLGPDDVGACLQLPPAAAVEKLIERALAEGAPDNVTVIAVRAGAAAL